MFVIYKIFLDDGSFIFADAEYTLTLFRWNLRKSIKIEDILKSKNYNKWHLIDKIGNKRIKRSFSIEETDEKLVVGMRYKLVQNIKVGDIVLGPNNEPRTVNELHNGNEEMYEIDVNGKTYTVNGGHVLALVDIETGEHLDIQTNVYMHMDDDFKSKYAMEIDI